MAMQDPAAVQVQEKAAEQEDVPQARAIKKPMAGEWRSTEDGGKIFIGDDGEPKFGGPKGPPATKPTHNVKLPPKRTKIDIDTADQALKQMGYKLGPSKFDLQQKKTSYQVTKPDGTTTTMSTDQIKDLVYDASENGK
jgi:hypothetical protein